MSLRPSFYAIFDLDGVIVSTDRYHRLAWERLAKEMGIPFTDEQAERTRGVDRMASLRVVLGPERSYPAAELEAMATRKNGYYLELIQRITPADLLPGASELLAELQTQGIPRALGSASKNAQMVLDLLGIADRFDTVVTGHDFARSKPAPDVFLTAAERLKASPAQCIVFEDAAAGVEAAQAAGMKTVGVGRPENVAGADRIVSSLAGVRYADLAAMMG